MPTLPQQIADMFLTELALSDDVSAEQVSKLGALMKKDAKLKAAGVEAIFAPPEDDDL